MRLLLLALVLATSRVAAADDDDGDLRYEILLTDSWVSEPITLVYPGNMPNHIAFVGANAFGVKIVEHGRGIISKINAAFLSGAGGYRGERDYGTYRVEYWDTTRLPPGPGGSWALDYSDDFLRFRMDSWFNQHVGWRFGLWSMRKLDSDPLNGGAMPGPTMDLLDRYGAQYLNNSGGLEIEFRVRFQQMLGHVARASLTFDLPVTYLIIEPLIALGGDGLGDRGLVYQWGGVPRAQLDIERAIGPLVVRATASIPTGWLVVPLTRGSELTLAAGVTF